jgi:UTP-glucose-1-phosphate uridylyltransferase
MRKHISKVLFPVAGLCTRFLSAAKASPNRMLPIVEQPLIHFTVEEAIAADITKMNSIFFNRSHHRKHTDHLKI